MTERTVSFTTRSIKIADLTVRVADSAVQMTQDVATLAQDYIESLLRQQPTVSIVLATGNSQLEFLDAIASSKRLDWSRIILFHLDEYLGIAAEHPGSFRYYLYHNLERKIRPCAFNYIQGDAPQPLAECDRYRQLLQQQQIDLCMLGIGDSGHLAFNEPTVADFQDSRIIKLVKLELETRQQQVEGGYFPNVSAVPSYAYTLTIPTICAANRIFCLAGGNHKTEIVRQTLTEEIAPSFPATILRTLPQATLFCDRQSFSLWES